MSRAFIKEPESVEPTCPGCAGAGVPVGPATVAAHLPASLARALAEAAFYCPTPTCRVAYFDGWGARADAASMTGRAWPKDPAGPLCSCFGIAASEIEADGRAGRTERLRALIERSRGPDARCGLAAPDGRCCMPEARRIYQTAI